MTDPESYVRGESRVRTFGEPVVKPLFHLFLGPFIAGEGLDNLRALSQDPPLEEA